MTGKETKIKQVVIKLVAEFAEALQATESLESREFAPLLRVIESYDGRIMNDYRRCVEEFEVQYGKKPNADYEGVDEQDYYNTMHHDFFHSGVLDMGLLPVEFAGDNVESFIDELEQDDAVRPLIRSVFA